MIIGLDSRLVKVVTIRDSAKLLVEMLRRDAQHVVFVQKTMGRYMVQRLNRNENVRCIFICYVTKCLGVCRGTWIIQKRWRNIVVGMSVMVNPIINYCLSLDSINFLWSPM